MPDMPTIRKLIEATTILAPVMNQSEVDKMALIFKKITDRLLKEAEDDA